MFRLLRPMRSISRFPGLKRLVVTILMAIPQLQLVLIVVVLFFVTFGTISVQVWKGVFLQRCHSPYHHAMCDDGDLSERELCHEREDYMFAHDSSPFCDLKGSDEGIGVGSICKDATSCEVHNENPYFDVISHDSILRSFIIILQLVTITNWQELMHIQMDTSGGPFAIIYYVTCVLLGGYFLLNLFVAVLKQKYEISVTVFLAGAQVFEEIDVDGSGDLDKEEINQIFAGRGVTLTEDELEQAFRKMDKDGDGYIDWEEFKHVRDR